MAWLVGEVRRAGYTPDLDEERIPPFANLCTQNIQPPADNADCTFESTDPTANDRIAVRRSFSSTSGNARDQQDCTGTDVSAAMSEEDVIVDVYWVERDSDEDDDDAFDDVLKCVSYDESTHTVIANTTQQVIASGIEGLQVLYAESPTGTEKNVTRYVAAAGNAIQFGSTGFEMENVMAIRIGILARSFSDNALTENTRSYILMDADPYTFNDRVNRQVVVTTVFSSNY